MHKRLYHSFDHLSGLVHLSGQNFPAESFIHPAAQGLCVLKKAMERRQTPSSLVGLCSKQKPIYPEKKRHMQYTESVVDCAKGMDQEPSTPVDWQTAFAQVKDPRRKQGQRYTILSILLVARASILSNHVSELAIAQWGDTQSQEVKKALGFQKGVTPHQSTIQRLFRRLSAEEVEAAFRSMFLQIFEKDKEERGACAVSIDGKAQRGRLKFEQEEAYPIHAVSIVEHKTGIVLTQGHVEQTGNETKNVLADTKTKNERQLS